MVTIKAKGKSIVLARGAKGWRIKSPVDYPADKYATDTIEKKLVELAFGDLITTRKDRHEHFDVSDAKSVRVTVSDGTKAIADFHVGRVESGFTFIRRHGDAAVYQAVGYLRSSFDKELRLWRNRKIMTVKGEDIRRLDLTTHVGTLVLSRKDPKAPWVVQSSPTPLPKLDQDAIKGVVSALATVTAHDFADGKSLKEAGLETPSGSVKVTLKDGSVRQLLLGAPKGKDEIFVQAAGNKQVFVLKKYGLKAFLRKPLDFKDKTVLSFDPSLVTKLVMAKVLNRKPIQTVLSRLADGTSWKTTGTALRASDKINKTLAGWAKLKAASFSTETQEALGLDKPLWNVTIALKDGSQFEITVGSIEQQSARAVKVSGQGDTFMVPTYVLDKILLDPKLYK